MTVGIGAVTFCGRVCIGYRHCGRGYAGDGGETVGERVYGGGEGDMMVTVGDSERVDGRVSDISRYYHESASYGAAIDRPV